MTVLTVIARSASDEAIHLSSGLAMDCFAEPVIGRRFAPTRWLAMTGKEGNEQQQTKATRHEQ
jgi:hypothetical protein